jgi:hypothetical protein
MVGEQMLNGGTFEAQKKAKTIGVMQILQNSHIQIV